MTKFLYRIKTTIKRYMIEIVLFAFLMLKAFKHYLTPQNIVQLSFRFIALSVLLLCLSFAAGRIINSADQTARDMLLILAALFAVSFSSNSVLMLDNWFKNFEVYKNTFAVLCVMLTFVLIDRPKIKWCIPFYCFACLIIQPYFAFMYLPMLVILFIYKTRFGENRSENKDLMASTLIASVLAFLISGLKVFADMVEIKKSFAENLEHTLLSFAIILPLSVIITSLFINAYLSSRDKVFRKIILLLIFEPVVLVFIIFLIKTDINLIITGVFVQIFFIFYFANLGNSVILISCEKLGRYFQKNLLILLLTVVFLASFSNFAKIVYVGLTQSKDFHGLWA